jgi:DNA-nicking Smr family endonuclease
VGRKKGNRNSGADGASRRGKRRSIRYEAEEMWPEDREPDRNQIRKLGAPPEILLRKLTVNEALDRLKTQLQAFAHQGKKEVLVVHGKGHNSPGGMSVLGPEVRHWCDDRPDVVASWREAPVKWGGEGAIVVKLK